MTSFDHVTLDWAGWRAEHAVIVPGFVEPVAVYLGPEEGADGADPTPLDAPEAQQTWDAFAAAAPDLHGPAYERYQRLYRGGLTATEHAPLMRELLYVRLLPGGTVVLPIRYEVDPEHGLEIRVVGGSVVRLGGIATT